MYKGVPIRLPTNFSADTIQTRMEQDESIQNAERKKLLTRNTISGKTVLQKNDGDKQNLRLFITTRPALQEMLKKDLLIETKGHYRAT